MTPPTSPPAVAGDPPLRAADACAAPAVSIVVPVYNAAAHLDACLDSILGQDERAIEVVVVDDGSTDDSRRLLAARAARDPRLRVVRHDGEVNRGVAASRNLGLAHARGDYLWFVDADDRLRPGAIATLLALARAQRTDVLAFNGEECGGGLPAAPIHRKPKPAGVVSGAIWVDCCCRQKEWRHFVWLRFYRRDYLRACALAFRDGIVHEDIAWITEGDVRAARFAYTDAILYDYARSAGSLTRREDDASLLHRAESIVEVVAQLRAINARCPMPARTRRLLRSEIVGQGVYLARLRDRIGDAALRGRLDERLRAQRFWRSLSADAVDWRRRRQVAQILVRESLRPGPPSAAAATTALTRFAAIAAGGALAITPFRATAGWRAGLLAAAFLALVAAHRRAGRLPSLLPPDRPLRLAAVLWLATAVGWSFAGPSWPDALATVKGDIVTPMLAFVVFYALTRTRADMTHWTRVMAAVLLGLTALAIREPYDPLAPVAEPAYVNVGWLSTWLVIFAPVIVLPLFPPRRRSRRGFDAAVLPAAAALCLFLTAWLSGNRFVWACFAAMVLVGAAIGLRGLHSSRERLRVVSVSALLLFVIGAFMAGSMQFRAQAAPPGSQGPLAFLLGDSRAPIWRVALDMIGERPLAGLGYANPELGDLFSARFDDPLFRQVFRHAHNVVLDYALQMGVTGALVVVLLFGTLAAAFYRRARGHGLARLAGVCGVALVVGMFLRNMTDDFFSRHGVLFFAAVAGMLLGLGTRRPPLAAVTRR